jgi:hypothetical protein
VSLSLIQLKPSPGNRHDGLFAFIGNAGLVVNVFITLFADAALPGITGFAPRKSASKLIGCRPSGLENSILLNAGDKDSSQVEHGGVQQQLPIDPI